VEYFAIFFLTVLSCLIYEKTGLAKTVKFLVASYRHQFSVMTDRSITDEMKQHELFVQIGIQLKLLFILVMKLTLLVSPFLIFILLDSILLKIGHDQLYRLAGIGISIITVLLYFLIKTIYVRLFIDRKISA
jgi:hypothetical protein